MRLIPRYTTYLLFSNHFFSFRFHQKVFLMVLSSGSRQKKLNFSSVLLQCTLGDDLLMRSALEPRVLQQL